MGRSALKTSSLNHFACPLAPGAMRAASNTHAHREGPRRRSALAGLRRPCPLVFVVRGCISVVYSGRSLQAFSGEFRSLVRPSPVSLTALGWVVGIGQVRVHVVDGRCWDG